MCTESLEKMISQLLYASPCANPGDLEPNQALLPKCRLFKAHSAVQEADKVTQRLEWVSAQLQALLSRRVRKG